MKKLAPASARSLARIVALSVVAGIVLAVCFLSFAFALDNGQWGNVDPKIREWFKSVRNHAGIPCCDIADGHRTTWRGNSEGGYEVPVEGEWMKVPPGSVILNAGNPVGEAVVWYGRQGNMLYIRCFVPGGGV